MKKIGPGVYSIDLEPQIQESFEKRILELETQWYEESADSKDLDSDRGFWSSEEE